MTFDKLSLLSHFQLLSQTTWSWIVFKKKKCWFWKTKVRSHRFSFWGLSTTTQNSQKHHSRGTGSWERTDLQWGRKEERLAHICKYVRFWENYTTLFQWGWLQWVNQLPLDSNSLMAKPSNPSHWHQDSSAQTSGRYSNAFPNQRPFLTSKITSHQFVETEGTKIPSPRITIDWSKDFK